GALGPLTQGLAAVATRLEPQEAAPAARTLTQALSKTLPPSTLRERAEALSATLTGDARNLPGRAGGLVMGVGANAHQPLLVPPAILLALEPLPCRFSTQELVDLLKHPLCVDEARRVVLEQLENRYRRTFADHWAFVRFAQQQNLGVDFTSPPRRPASLI